jgi:exopolysaccharide biosynthesis polyprenyl glycosylphosphotransferase
LIKLKASFTLVLFLLVTHFIDFIIIIQHFLPAQVKSGIPTNQQAMLLTKERRSRKKFASATGNAIRNMHKIMIIVDDLHAGIIEKINYNRDWGYQIIYILTDSPEIKAHFQYRSRIYSIKANIRSLLRHDIVDDIVCCMSTLPEGYLKELSAICNQFGVSLLVTPSLDNSGLLSSSLSYIGSLPFNTLETTPRNRVSYGAKTFFESTLALSALIILMPFLLIVALLIKTTSRGPVFFKQLRVGLRGRKFYMYKFRTMVINAEKLKAALMEFNESDGPAFKIKNDPRITKIGRFLRKTGLDEIPQLLNVLRGEMSLIGPRPMLPEEVSAQEEWQLKRMSVKPGISCSWQVEPSRNSVPFDQWMKLDKEYVENWSIGNDIRLIFRTIRSIFAARGL